MKYLISFFLPVLFARPFILLTYDIDKSKADKVEEIFLKYTKLPRICIDKIKKKRPCEKNMEALAHFCVDNLGQLKEVRIQKKLSSKIFNTFFKEDI